MKLPDQPSRRRILVVLSPADYEHVEEKRPEGYERQDLRFISSDIADTKDDLLGRLGVQHDLVAGLTLVLNPFDPKSYIDAEAASEELVVRKAHIIARLAQLLGARRLEIVAATDLQTGTTLNVKAEASAGVSAVDASGEKKDLVRYAQSASLTDEFPGSDPDVDAARSLLQSTGLDDDMVLTGLVEARANGANRLTRRKLTVNMTREAERTIAAALGLRHGVGKASMKGGGKVSSKQDARTSISFTYQIDF